MGPEMQFSYHPLLMLFFLFIIKEMLEINCALL